MVWSGDERVRGGVVIREFSFLVVIVVVLLAGSH